MKKLDSKLQKQRQGWPKISNTARKYNKMKIWKITTAKFKCTREHILGHDWLIKITWEKARAQNWEESSESVKFKNILRANFFMFILLISNHTVFLVQFGINLHLWVFQKAEIALAEAARTISAFWKTHSCKLIPNWTRNRMITYTNIINFHHVRNLQMD